MKRYLAVFLCLCLIGMGWVLRSAEAEEVTVDVGGTGLNMDGSSVTGGSGTATLTYENGNPVLTLDNYTYNGAGYGDAAIYYDGRAPLTIRLVGTSSVTHKHDNSSFSYGPNSYGFYSQKADAAITIEGTGSLKLHSGNEVRISCGMSVGNSLTISGGQLEAVGGDLNLTDDSGTSVGILCFQSLT